MRSTNAASLNLFIAKGVLSAYWKEILRTYSVCRLTKIEDKLVAMSGIIRKIQLQSKDDCIAGLWISRIKLELLWHISKPGTQPAVYMAPSWSWASVTAEVFHFSHIPMDNFTNLYAHVLKIHVDPCGDDPLGQLKGGSISVLCQTLVHAILLDSPSDNRLTQLSNEQISPSTKQKWFSTHLYFGTRYGTSIVPERFTFCQ